MMRTARRRNGFSLVEVLVVVAIIAIMAVSVTIPVLSRSPSAGDRAAEIAGFVARLRDEAMFNGRDLALEFGRDRLRVLELDRRAGPAGAWALPGEGDPLARPPDWPGMALELAIEGRPATPGALSADLKPGAFFTSSGETTPFVLSLRDSGGRRAGFTVDAFGAIRDVR